MAQPTSVGSGLVDELLGTAMDAMVDKAVRLQRRGVEQSRWAERLGGGVIGDCDGLCSMEVDLVAVKLTAQVGCGVGDLLESCGLWKLFGDRHGQSNDEARLPWLGSWFGCCGRVHI
ncbi:hypothetical protein M0R45_016419 [Rubus argutus]|uniref:Uncharacterized protein n=1 Tax=Rubus argutus TaxID=59490 RepID=A0AAW1XUH6_RUBAR